MVNGLEAVSTTTLYSFTLMRGVALVVSCDTGTSDSVPHGAAEFWFLLISQLMAGGCVCVVERAPLPLACVHKTRLACLHVKVLSRQHHSCTRCLPANIFNPPYGLAHSSCLPHTFPPGFFWTVIVGIMSTLVMAMDRSGSLYVEKLQLWSDYCYSRRLPRHLRKRVIDFLNLTHANR